MTTRRRFLRTAAVAFPAVWTARAATYDLVLRGGRVLDPSQNLDRVLDLGIQAGKITALGSKLSAAREIDVTGKLVVPGLIDIHVHARDAELPPSEFLSTGVTTMVDAGSRGADNIAQIVDIAAAAPNRMRLLLNVARLGNNPNGRSEFLDSIDPADVDKARAAVARHRPWILGIKARLSRGISADRDLEVLRRAIRVAEPFDLPVMIHMGDTFSPLPQILALLRKGDVVTHVYAPPPNGILDAQGRLLPEVLSARRRGVRFDFGNGLNEHWAWDVAEKALRQGFAPDTITSDLSVPGRSAQVFDLPNVLSKFLVLGMPLNQVIARATRNAADTFRELKPYGSLRKGAAADITVLELTEGSFEFVDNYKGTRTGSRKLVTRNVIVAGKPVS